MTLPRELALKKIADQYYLAANPVKELQMLRTARKTIDPKNKIEQPSGSNEILLEFDLSDSAANDFGIEFSNTKNERLRIGFDKLSNRFYIDRSEAGKNDFNKEFASRHIAPRLLKENKLTMHIFTDRSSAELFADDGTIVMPD
jgi:fructan beta-fructosidase